ncbi:hypothetical protein C1R92_11035, partial [Streptococcus pneumoniae]|nr:hypothetical protein [Streptococcus pneumoniae]MCG8130147.1 hypothetical protein [Streptococcus pneumoniae]MCG8132200.1 hypothetical protein [Streptococcus pneumoniae]MCG8134253.1 hypothetical protein [Streptococcus pneumoniae]MCG8136294.1 hypothetical protein [Streptococcus pneumoniae]
MGLFFYNKIGSIISIGDLPTTNIIEPDKKDQAQSAWSFSSIIKYSKKKSVLDMLGGSLFSGFGRCDRKG